MCGDLVRLWCPYPKQPPRLCSLFLCEQAAEMRAAGPVVPLSLHQTSSPACPRGPAHAIELRSSSICHIMTRAYCTDIKQRNQLARIKPLSSSDFLILKFLLPAALVYLCIVFNSYQNQNFDFSLKIPCFPMAIPVSRNISFRHPSSYSPITFLHSDYF